MMDCPISSAEQPIHGIVASKNLLANRTDLALASQYFWVPDLANRAPKLFKKHNLHDNDIYT